MSTRKKENLPNGKVARISPAMLYGQETIRRKDANRKHQNLCIMTKEEFSGLFQ